MADLAGLAQAASLQSLWTTGLLCALVLAWLLVWFFVASWVHGDASTHGMPGLPWFLFVFVLGLVGLLVYLTARSLRTSSPPAEGGNDR